MNDGPFRDDAASRMLRGDMRNMQQAQCQSCKNIWWAPTIGKCPKCRADGAEVMNQMEIGAPRV